MTLCCVRLIVGDIIVPGILDEVARLAGGVVGPVALISVTHHLTVTGRRVVHGQSHTENKHHENEMNGVLGY